MSHTPDITLPLSLRFRPVFERIAQGAVQRESERELLHEAVGWLRDAGFGALRVPQEQGGLGASVEELFDLVIDLAEADSNLPQALRSHFGFIERARSELQPEQAAPWLALAGQGGIFGNGTTEVGDGTVGVLQTVLTPDAKDWRLSGDKYYSTGSLYADWIAITARRQGADTDDRVIAMVRATAPGVERSDDWRGFGQRLTASGTTRLRNVAVPDEHIFVFDRSQPSSITALFQLFHIATLAGVARAILRDAVAYVQARQRVYSQGSAPRTRDDPLVQQVVGHLSAVAFSATAAAREVARGLGDIDRLRAAGHAVPEALVVDVELRAAQAQVSVSEAVLGAATRLFDVGGASALDEDRRLDRHWRNARTLASHNPAIYKARALGDHALNGTRPTFYWSVGVAPA
ncbi:acyl-CoA dehydrogenase family protein [Xylophilus sp. GW821-FHT01B05]